ncbi:MAG: response regulator [Enterocloster sp.]
MDRPVLPLLQPGHDCIKRYLFDTEPAQQAAESFDFTGVTVPLAEDSEINREIAVELLEGFGLKLDTAINGIEAVRLFRESRPGYYALILMDIQMPEMNGYEVARTAHGTLPFERRRRDHPHSCHDSGRLCGGMPSRAQEAAGMNRASVKTGGF